VQVAYAIGVAEPLSIRVDTFGTGKLNDDAIVGLIRKHWNLKPAGIVATYKLKRPIYRKTAAYGHFGRELPEFTWENLDKVEVLKSALASTVRV
jgi:S-adenosylmethionine synthetase